MKIQQVQVNTGIQIEYSLSGEENDPTILFVHGLGSNLHQFELQQQFFSKKYRVLIMSLRGHGNSSFPVNPTMEDFTMRKLASDAQALLSYLDISKVHFVGNSMGGLVGYELLKTNADMLLSLTTFGTTAKLHTSSFTLWTILTILRLLGPRCVAHQISKTATMDRDVGAQLKKMYESMPTDVLELCTRNIADYDYTDTIRKHDIPMILIKGGLDCGINQNLDSTLKVLGEKPGFEFHELPYAGHFLNMEKSAYFNDYLNLFLLKQSIRSHL